MSSTVRVALCLALAGLLPGCGTFINLSHEKAFYGGVQTDLEYAESPPLPQDELGWFWTVDLPFSAIADTFLIPVYGMRALFVELTPHIDRGVPPGETGPKGVDGRRPPRPREGALDPASRTPQPPRLRPTDDFDKVDPLQ